MDEMEIVREKLGLALEHYSQGEMQKHFVEAKKLYFSLTGMVDEDSEEYESKMHCFNDWFLFNYRSSSDAKSFIEEYSKKNSIEIYLQEAFSGFLYTLFEFRKVSFRKQIVLDDLLHKKKYVLAKKHHHLGVLEGDIFLGRLITLAGNHFLLDGICVLPNKFKSHYLKQAKMVRKLKKPEKDLEFLTKLEALKSKWIRYGRVDIEKIFIF